MKWRNVGIMILLSLLIAGCDAGGLAVGVIQGLYTVGSLESQPEAETVALPEVPPEEAARRYVNAIWNARIDEAEYWSCEAEFLGMQWFLDQRIGHVARGGKVNLKPVIIEIVRIDNNVVLVSLTGKMLYGTAATPTDIFPESARLILEDNRWKVCTE